MIYTLDSWLSLEKKEGEDYIVYSLEDGLMNDLFDAGHIIYNDYAPPMSQYDYSDRNRLSIRGARTGGAYWLLELEVGYFPDGEATALLPGSVSFRFTNIISEEIGFEGQLLTDEFLEDPSKTPRDICRDMGNTLSGLIIGFLQ